MSTTIKSSDGLQIDGRVSIAMDALGTRQKRVVRRVLSDRESFLSLTSGGRRARKVSISQPIYAVSVPPGLDIIFRVSGEAIEIMDLMGTATFKRFAAKKPRLSDEFKNSGDPGGRAGSSSHETVQADHPDQEAGEKRA